MLSVKTSQKKNNVMLGVIVFIIIIIVFLLLKDRFIKPSGSNGSAGDVTDTNSYQQLLKGGAKFLDTKVLDSPVFDSLIDNSVAPRATGTLPVGNSHPFQGN